MKNELIPIGKLGVVVLFIISGFMLELNICMRDDILIFVCCILPFVLAKILNLISFKKGSFKLNVISMICIFLAELLVPLTIFEIIALKYR